MIKKTLFIFLLCTGLFLGTANFSFAGDVSGDCYCSRCSDIASGKAAPLPDSVQQAASSDTVNDRCQSACVTMGPTVYCVRNLHCVASGELLRDGMCAAPASEETSAPAAETPEPSDEGVPSIDLPNPLGTTDIPALIGRVIRAALGIIGSIALLMFMYGGFTWLTAAGNSKKVEQGKQILIWATIGLVIIFISYTAVNFVLSSLTNIGGESPQTEETGDDGFKPSPFE